MAGVVCGAARAREAGSDRQYGMTNRVGEIDRAPRCCLGLKFNALKARSGPVCRLIGGKQSSMKTWPNRRSLAKTGYLGRLRGDELEITSTWITASTAATSLSKTALRPWPSGVSWRPESPGSGRFWKPVRIGLRVPGCAVVNHKVIWTMRV